MADILNSLCIDQVSKYVLGKTVTTPSLTLGLYVNNYTPTSESLLANFTECTAPGYARIALPQSGWTGSTVLGVATYTYTTVTFSLSGPGSPAQTIYGHFILDLTSNKVWWAQLWTTPYVIPGAPTSQPSITPQWQMQMC